MAEKKRKGAELRAQVMDQVRDELGDRLPLADSIAARFVAAQVSARGKAEADARALFRELEAVLQRGRALASKHPDVRSGFVGQLSAPTLGWWQGLAFAPSRPWEEPKRKTRSSRARLAELLAMPAAATGIRTVRRQAALLSLLAGHWPEKFSGGRPATVGEVISEESKLMNAALNLVERRIERNERPDAPGGMTDKLH